MKSIIKILTIALAVLCISLTVGCKGKKVEVDTDLPSKQATTESDGQTNEDGVTAEDLLGDITGDKTDNTTGNSSTTDKNETDSTTSTTSGATSEDNTSSGNSSVDSIVSGLDPDAGGYTGKYY